MMAANRADAVGVANFAVCFEPTITAAAKSLFRESLAALDTLGCGLFKPHLEVFHVGLTF
jgi:hypothetical protein